MNKGRVEAFTDAVVAIIMTIMVLEFKTPETSNFRGILHQWPYLFAYAVSFFYISVAWYNHHYMFSYVKRVTKKIYWTNNIWLFTMSLIPVATAWAGAFITDRDPEYFYFITFMVWTAAYVALSKEIRDEVERDSPENVERIESMPIFRLLVSKSFILLNLVVVVGIYFYPPIAIIFTLFELIWQAAETKDDSEFGEN